MTKAGSIYRTGLGVSAVVIAVFALSFGDAIIKLAGLNLPLWQMFVLRSALVVAPLWWWVLRTDRLKLGSLFWVSTRSAALVVMWLCYYAALPKMPLSLAAASYYTAPIMITVITSILAKRWPTAKVALAIALGFAGVVFVLRPNTSDFNIAMTLPLFAAFLYACAMVITSTKCREDDPFALALALSLAFIIAGLCLGLFSGVEGSHIFGPWQSLDFQLLGVIVILAAAVLIGSAGAAIAYQNGPPATIAAFDYSYLVFSLIWGAVFFAEIPGSMALLGILIIVLAGFLSISRPSGAAN